MNRPVAGPSALSLSLWAGAVYDWTLAAAIFLATPGFMAWLGFPSPVDPFLFRLSAMPPLLFPVVYVAAARDPVGSPWAVRASIQLRLVGGLLLLCLTLVHQPPGAGVYLKAAAVDVLLGLIHFLLAKKDPPAQGDASG